MQNAWNVQFIEDDRVLVKIFEGDSPKESGAVKFAKELKLRGLRVDIISRRKGFAPPQLRAEPPGPGLLWCPYCIKWREFEESSVVRGDYETPSLLRCSTCLISIKDYYVRVYNPIFVERHEIELEMKKAKAPTKPVLRKRRR